MTEHSFSAPEALVLQLLAWVDAQPHRYGETIEAWRTSCPRLPVWEDALSARLVEICPLPGSRLEEAVVRLTPEGAALLAGAARR